MPIAVSIVEDDSLTREGLSRLINRAPDLRCVSQHGTAEDAIEKVPVFKPDVVLVDINLPGLSGIEAVRRLKILLPDTQFIVLTVYKDNDAIFSALNAGANGYLLKQVPAKDLLVALREVCAGGSPLTSQIARKVVEAFRQTSIRQTSFRLTGAAASDSEGLTQRESEVLELLSHGYLYKEIADQLEISYRTVSTHIEHIYEKLHVHSRAQAAVKHFQKA